MEGAMTFARKASAVSPGLNRARRLTAELVPSQAATTYISKAICRTCGCEIGPSGP